MIINFMESLILLYLYWRQNKYTSTYRSMGIYTSKEIQGIEKIQEKVLKWIIKLSVSSEYNNIWNILQ